MLEVKLRKIVLDEVITCEATFLDSGMHVLLYGGHSSHVGSVSTASPTSAVRTLTVPGHKEFVISEKWASILAAASQADVCICCGIHYDQAGAEDISSITRATDDMLDELLESMK